MPLTNSNPHINEEELLAGLRDENSRNSAFSVLMKHYQQRVYWHIRKILIDPDETDDATQNTFVCIWRNLDKFRQESRLYTWIYRIATNEALAVLRKRKRRSILRLDDVGEELALRIDNPAFFSGNQVERKLFKALVQLPEKQKLVFQMRYFEDLSYEDIGEILGTSVGGLKANYHHAVKKLEKYLEQP